MKILAVAPECISFPIGLSYVVAAMKDAGFDVDCINMSINPRKEIPYQNYDIVATGGLARHFNQIAKIVKDAKQADCTVILGGGIITAEPEFISQNIKADYYVLAEGERAVVKILESIRDGNSIDPFVTGEPIGNLDELPFPDYDSFGLAELLDKFKSSDAFFADIMDQPRPYPIIASRSCPYRCTFCYSPLGTKYRQRSVDSIIDELSFAIPKYKINIIQLMDELISYDEERIYEFCTKFDDLRKKFPWEIKWGGCLRVDKLKGEMLDRVKRCGFEWVQFGFESYSSTVLKSMKKNITPDQIQRAIQLTLEKNIRINGAFIFGDVAETMETANETLSFWKNNLAAGIDLIFILPLPNSEIYQHCIKNNIITDKIEYYKNGLHTVRNMTSMSAKEFADLKRKVEIHSIKYSIKAIPKSVTNNNLTIVCPHCNKMQTYNNYVVSYGPKYNFPIKKGKLFVYNQIFCRSCTKKFYVTSPIAAIWLKLVSNLYNPVTEKIYSIIFGKRAK